MVDFSPKRGVVLPHVLLEFLFCFSHVMKETAEFGSMGETDGFSIFSAEVSDTACMVF